MYGMMSWEVIRCITHIVKSTWTKFHSVFERVPYYAHHAYYPFYKRGILCLLLKGTYAYFVGVRSLPLFPIKCKDIMPLLPWPHDQLCGALLGPIFNVPFCSMPYSFLSIESLKEGTIFSTLKQWTLARGIKIDGFFFIFRLPGLGELWKGGGGLLGGYIRLWDFMGIGYKVMGLWFNFFWF